MSEAQPEDQVPPGDSSAIPASPGSEAPGGSQPGPPLSFPPEPPAFSSPEPYPFWGYRDILLIAAIALPLLALSFALTGGLYLVMGWAPRDRVLQVLPAQVVFYVLWFVFLYTWIKVRFNRPFWRSLAFGLPRQGVASSLGWGVLTAMIVVALGALLRTPEIEMPLTELLRSRLAILLVGTVAVTLGPLFEELAFRGLLQPLLARSLGPSAGIVVTACLFASLHGPEYAWSWRHVALVALAGCAFGWMRHRTGSTATATAMHAAYNFTFFMGMVAQKGI